MSQFATEALTNFSKNKKFFQELLEQNQQTAEKGNQTSLVSSTSVGDKNPNKTLIDTGNGAIENAEGNVGVYSRHFPTHGSRKPTTIANSRSSRRRQTDEMELENLRSKNETEQQLQERQLELEQEHEEIELCRQQEELRLQQQPEQELRLQMQQQEGQLRLQQHERVLENKRKKAEADEEQKRLKFELIKGSSRASGSVADQIESVVSRHNHERTAGWAESVIQQSVPRRPLSPNVIINPPTNVTQDKFDKRFSTSPKTTPLCKTGEGLFSTQLTEPHILKQTEIRKSIRVTEPPTPLTKTTFLQQGTSAVQDKNRSQSLINNSRNRSSESRNGKTLNQTTPQVIHQPVPSSGASGLPKPKQTDFSGDPLYWSKLSGLFDVVVQQKLISDTEKMQYLKASLTGQAKAAIKVLGFSSQSNYYDWDIFFEKYGRSDVIVNAQFKKIHTHPPVRYDDSTSIVKFVSVVTNVVNTLTQLGYTSDLESEGGLSATTRKLSLQLREQWLQYMQDSRLLRVKLIVFKEWLASKAVFHEHLLANTSSSFDRNSFKAVLNQR